MKTTVLGSYPKIPARSGPSVRQAIQRFERRTIGPKELEQVYRAATRRAISVCQNAGLTRITDGQIRWNDLTDPIVRDTDNLLHGGLERFFDNNFYYREPTVVGRLQYQGGVVAEWTRLAVADSTTPMKVALPGPITMAAMADDKSYGDRELLVEDLLDVLALEAQSVARAGAVEIQWDEPAAVAGTPVDPAFAVKAWTALVGANPGLEQSLAFYFGPAGGFLDQLAAVGLRRVYIDLVSEPSLADRLAVERLPFEVGLGLIDARNVRLEDRDRIVPLAARIAARQGSQRVWLHPNAGLEFLPPDRAEAKVKWLGALGRLIEEEEQKPHA